jgi:ABC-type glycerol-3-phosphate transport system substrate-binding protein
MIGAILPGLLACACSRDEAGGQSAVLTVWAHHGQAAEHAAMQAIVADFNAAAAPAGPRVRITFFPDQQYADKVSIAAATGELPDIIEIDGPYVGPWAAEGLLQPLGDLIAPDVRADLMPTIVQQGTYAGELYAVGAFDSGLAVYFNRDLLARANIVAPERVADAWDWDEFVAALRAVQPHVDIPLSLHLGVPADEWLTYAFAPLVWSNGGGLIDVAGGRVEGVLNSPATVTAVRRWQQLFAEGLAMPTSSDPDPFAGGKAAFDWTGHWMLPGYEQTAGLRFGVMPLPRMGARAVVSAGSWCWGISPSCADRAAAGRFLNHLLDARRGIQPIVVANGAIPGRRSAFELFPEFERGPRALFRAQLDACGRARPRTPVYLALTSAFARALRDVSLGAEPQAALDFAARSVQFDLDRIRTVESPRP